MTVSLRKVAVVGAGLMGQGIAVAALRGGADVVVWDLRAVVPHSEQRIRERLAAAPAAASGTGEGRLTSTAELADAVAGADLVIECLPEDVQLKVETFKAIDEISDDGVPFVTNTSSVSLHLLKAAVRAERALLAGHFFNPAEIAPGVEIAAVDPVSQRWVPRITALLESWGKSPVEVGSSPAFVANRLQLALFREAVLCVEEGLVTAADLDELVKTTFGFRLAAYGVFKVADMAGLNVFGAILANLDTAFGSRFSLPGSVKEMVEEENWGLATGAGYYSYPADVRDALLSERDARYAAVLAAAGSTGGSERALSPTAAS
ncbi:3-hydroxyacyl-CoA dehydrogenase family protein [Amycolatopsis ultiminotia]|uniref:3-hydroxyacyl-CoA dehydrogenase family protein n=1 Tax=Amycolatopsis ultiminotia TaxID=543629 RepID=A0ABP6YPG1_9PSEU